MDGRREWWFERGGCFWCFFLEDGVGGGGRRERGRGRG